MKQCWHRWLWFNILCVLVLATLLPPTSAQKPKVSKTSTTAAPVEEEAPLDDQLEESEGEANATDPRLTGNPQIDYIYDPNLPRELNGYNLSDYPFLDRLPKAEAIEFTCDNLHDGFYASIALKCQVYHHCLSGLRQDFLCPVYTAFDQKTFICHFVNKVDCVNSENHWNRNDNLYRPTTTTTTTTTTTRAPPRDYRDYYDYDDRPRRRRPYGRGKMRPAFDDYDYDRYERRRPAPRRPLSRRRPYDDEEEEEDVRPYRRPRPRDDDIDRPISRDERPRRPLEDRLKRIDDDDDDDIRPKRPVADGLRPKRPVAGAERTKRPIDEEVIAKRPIEDTPEDADDIIEDLKPKRPDFSRLKGSRPRKERPVHLDEESDTPDVIKPRDERPSVDSRSSVTEEETRPLRPRNRRPNRDDSQKILEDRTLKGKPSEKIPEDLTQDALEADEPLYRPMGDRKRPYTNRNIDDEDRIEKQEPTVLVKPNGPSIFSQPRLPPKIKRPVPVNAKEKYEYVTITTSKAPEVLDDYDYEDSRRPLKKGRKPEYEDEYEPPRAKNPRAKPRNRPKHDEYYDDY